MMLEIGHASLPRARERVNGDAVVVRQEGDSTLFAVIDALGHGPHAAEVAGTAVSCLRDVRIDWALEDILEALHRALRASRGAAALLCVVRGDHLRGTSVGNVALRSATKGGLSFVSTPGILGGAIRRPRVFEARLRHGDRLVCFTDGVSGRFPFDETRGLPAGRSCRVILESHRRPEDDATVLVVDVSGPPQPRELDTHSIGSTAQ